VGSTGLVLHSCSSSHEISTHYFSCSGEMGTDITKSAMGHVTPNLYFCIQWDLQVT
jgi:hypothetical protein